MLSTEPDWQRVAASMIQARYKIDAFDAAVVAVVVMPAEYLVFVRVRLFSDPVIDDEHTLFPLDVPHIGLNDLPQIGSAKCFARQPALNLVMPYVASQQLCQARSGGRTACTDQVIAIDVQQFFVFHPTSLTHLCVR